jgi:hypothetical protein
MFEYHIEVRTKGKWTRIASFDSECDRDDCQSYLAEKYDDCQFRNAYGEDE